jgi:cytochrome c
MSRSSDRRAGLVGLLAALALSACGQAEAPAPVAEAAASDASAAPATDTPTGLATGHFGPALEAVEISLAFRPEPVSDRAGYYGYGRAPTAEEIAGWDIDVRPDGTGLPVGSGSVADGEMLYEEKCAECHGSFGEGQGRWPVLAGGQGSLTHDRPDKTVGSYWPYASTLWDYVHRAMPFYAPQSLTDDEVYAISAYVLYLNDIVDDEFVLTHENLASIEMPNADGFFSPDPRPDVRNAACMDDCKDPSEIRITWDSTALGVTPTEHFREEDEAPARPAASTTGDKDAGGAVPELAALDAEVGARTYAQACQVCHAAGLAGAPKTDDGAEWGRRAGQGWATLVMHAVNGYQGEAGYMPAKGGQAQLSDEAVAAAVAHMLQSAGVEVE